MKVDINEYEKWLEYFLSKLGEVKNKNKVILKFVDKEQLGKQLESLLRV